MLPSIAGTCSKRKSSHNSWLRGREIGQTPSLGSTNDLSKRLYSSIKCVGSWDHGQNLRNAVHGGVFNLEFSPDGSLLVAACEKKSILMFDPLTRRMIHGIDDAHNECVNCVRFLDSRLFATCSDDTTVALWDARSLKQRIHTLRGHKNWVKNIEFSAKDDLLVTSGFDGSIYTWDINNYADRRVFHTNGLMRMRLGPDASKMVISTTGGYLMVVHDLDLNKMAQDLAGFKPNMYRLEQQNEWRYPNGENFNHLFSRRRKRNRVEFITDFPNGVEAEVISSLQLHPQGWCALSRNICNEESAEWTCVHDIQDLEGSDDDEDVIPDPRPSPPSSPVTAPDDVSTLEESSLSPGPLHDVNGAHVPLAGSHVIMSPHGTSNVTAPRPRSEVILPPRPPAGSLGHRVPRYPSMRSRGTSARPDQPVMRRLMRVGEIVRHGGTYTANLELQVSTNDVWEALVAVREARASRQQDREARAEEEGVREGLARLVNRNNRLRAEVEQQLIHDTVRDQRTGEPPSNEPVVREGRLPTASGSFVDFRMVSNPAAGRPDPSTYPFNRFPRSDGSSRVRRRSRLYQNVPRLLNYIEEPNVGKGFIKELCFSSDGRLICSPFSFGVRLLAFSPECAELSTCAPTVSEPVKLYELGSNICHSNTVLSSKFSPKHCLLVSGCLNGKIVWYQPVL